ncbi:nuclear transport factor 2 family protein [Sphingomonas crocodyli]|uniref:Nuclear transport factor 2 family protein n=1 Tax=Sphingomonas crocodyli TaxID=1979270 RepID=A0A437M9J1_9SPHN|nr:nuclear transport factor 2 family protein [Sphingomonas crocodyli]RVT94195.1 nuclear transport factor 2 family protein [Sphingomonas crocodyli]
MMPDPMLDAELGALVIGYGCALDARDWAGFRALFLDEITLDYGAIGSIVGPISADAWADRCRALGGFDATLHRVTNIRCRLMGDDVAMADSYVDALHFVADGGGMLLGHLVGRYHHRFGRDGAGRWRIARCDLAVSGYPNGQDSFVRAFALARARFAGEDR